MPPSGFKRKAIQGALQFIEACYHDLLEEVKSGKHASYEEAIEFEISQINKALTKAHINEEGKLVEKE